MLGSLFYMGGYFTHSMSCMKTKKFMAILCRFLYDVVNNNRYETEGILNVEKGFDGRKRGICVGISYSD